jgi:ribulose-phosphate 3-epimerase
MGIGRIGFQGQNFDERVFEKIAEIRTKYPTMLISVDGGVNEDSAPLLIDAGVNRLIVGSAIFESDNIPEAIHTFENI